MQVKSFKGYRGTMGVKVKGELTIEDFNIIETPAHGEYSGVGAGIKIELKPERVQDLMPALPKNESYDYSLKKSVSTPRTVWEKNHYISFEYRGCKGEESKQRKREKVHNEVAGHMAKNRDSIIAKLIARVNEVMVNWAERLTYEYTKALDEVMTGQRMSREFITENLDDPTIAQELQLVEEEIKNLKEKRNALDEKLRQKRNENMLRHLNENGWNDEDEDEDEKVRFMPELQEKYTTLYTNGEAFSVSRHPFG